MYGNLEVVPAKQKDVASRLNISVEAIGPVSSTVQWVAAAVTVATINTAIATAQATVAIVQAP